MLRLRRFWAISETRVLSPTFHTLHEPLGSSRDGSRATSERSDSFARDIELERERSVFARHSKTNKSNVRNADLYGTDIDNRSTFRSSRVSSGGATVSSGRDIKEAGR